MIVNGFEKVNWASRESATLGRTLSEKKRKAWFSEGVHQRFPIFGPNDLLLLPRMGWDFFLFYLCNCVSYISELFSESSSEISWSSLPFDCWQLSYITYLFLKCLALEVKVKSLSQIKLLLWFPMSFQLPGCLQWPLFHLAMAIFIFILFLLQWSFLSWSYFIFGCRPSPCPFNCLGVCNGPQRHRPRKVLLSLPSFTKNIFTTP